MVDRSFWKAKRVLVTGGAGSVVVDQLVSECGVSRGNVVVPRSVQNDLREFDTAFRVSRDVQIVIRLPMVTGGIEYRPQTACEPIPERAVAGCSRGE